MPGDLRQRGRDVVRWHSIDDLAWMPFPAGLSGALGGADGRLLSASDDGLSQTWLLRVADGWSGAIQSKGVSELFVTEGGLRVGDTVTRVGGFVGVPEGAGEIALTSVAESTFLLFVNQQFDPDHCYPEGRVHVVASKDLPWDLVGERGVAVKRLRPGVAEDDSVSPVGFLNLLLFLPGFVSDEVEFHNTWEEMVYLDGDFFMVERGNAGTASYHANPAGALHGPFGTQWGSWMIHHAIEPYRTDFDHRPGGLARVGEYLDSTPFDAARPKTEKWDDIEHMGRVPAREETR